MIDNSAGRAVNDGFFEIKYEQDGVYIVVYPSLGKGRRVEEIHVMEKLKKKCIHSFNKDAINMAILKAEKVPVKIAEAQEEQKINATVLVQISSDRLKASISIFPPEGGRMLNVDEIMEALKNQGVIYGIDTDAVETASKYPVYNQIIQIAQASPPQNGQNGKIEFSFNTSKEHKPTILEDGRVDYRELNLIESVIKGDKLCWLTPATKGIPGKTVTGADILALDGKPATLPKGRNVAVTEDGEILIASVDGQVCYLEGKVNVFSNYEVPADVDNSTGNIYFTGNVIVRGNVLSGFAIEAGGNVEVWGVVEGATIKATGDIILRRGMQGLGKGSLISGGDIIAKYIEHSNIEAKGDIKSEAIMHSNIKCGNKLELSGKKGLLVGGTCKVGKEISAKVVGSHMATPTEIEVGVDPTLRERYKFLKEEKNKMDSDIKKADQAISILKKIEAAGAMTPEKQEMMVKSVRTKLFLSNQVKEYSEEMVQIEEKLQQDANGKIRASTVIYAGTKVAIGSCMMYVKENLQYCTLYREGADIRTGSIDR